jgi:hypothetical protein
MLLCCNTFLGAPNLLGVFNNYCYFLDSNLSSPAAALTIDDVSPSVSPSLRPSAASEAIVMHLQPRQSSDNRTLWSIDLNQVVVQQLGTLTPVLPPPLRPVSLTSATSSSTTMINSTPILSSILAEPPAGKGTYPAFLGTIFCRTKFQSSK